MDINNPQLFDLVSRFLWLIITLAVADSIIRALALWRSARNSQQAWFICLIIFNTLGLLPLIYILFFSQPKGKK